MDHDPFLDEFRRLVVIDRHRELLGETERSISDGFIDGSINHPRLQAMLNELEEDSEQNRIHASLAKLLHDPLFNERTLQDGIIGYLSLIRDETETEVASLQIHAVGIYRAVKELLQTRRGWVLGIDALRSLPLQQIARINSQSLPGFGSAALANDTSHPACVVTACAQCIHQIRHFPTIASDWTDDTQPDQIPRDLIEAAADYEEPKRSQHIRLLLADRVRHDFYAQVFLHYFSADELDPAIVAGHPTILHWIESIIETPHLYPFMQGQSMKQKNWRLQQLVAKILQLNEIYARVDQARSDAALADQLRELDTRAALGALAHCKYPPLPVNDRFLAVTFQYPFAAFVAWLQERVAQEDFVLPPESRRHSGTRGH